MKRLPLLFSLALINTAAVAALPDVINQSYEQARPKLIENGLSPMSPEEIEALEGSSVLYGPGESEMFRMGYTEVSSCTGAGIPLCTFLLKEPSGSAYRIVVYVPEGGGPTRVESVTALPSPKDRSAQQGRDLKDLEQRIAATNRQRTDSSVLSLSACSAECIAQELNAYPPLAKPIGTYIDPKTGYELPDYRNLNIVDFQKMATSLKINGIPSRIQRPVFNENLPYVIQQLTSGATQNCTHIIITNEYSCALLYKDQVGYLYLITAAGAELANFSVKSVALVNGDPKYAEHTTPEFALALQAKERLKLYQTDVNAFRREMVARHTNTDDAVVNMANAIHATTYESPTCNALVGQAYLAALSSQPEQARIAQVSRTIDHIVYARCAKMN